MIGAAASSFHKTNREFSVEENFNAKKLQITPFKITDWFLYDRDRRPERVILYLNSVIIQENAAITQDHFKIHVSLVVISCVILN